MKKTLKVIRILFEVVGGLAIVLCCYLYYAFRGTMRTTAPCAYSQVFDVPSPDGKMVAEKRQQICSYGTWVEVRLGTEGDEVMDYSKIITLQKVDPEKIDLRWTSPRDLQVTLPKDALLLEAYGYQWGVTINRVIVDR